MPAPYATHRKQLELILRAWGMAEATAAGTAEIMSWADLHGIDLADAVLLQLAQKTGAGELATDDQRLGKVCLQYGITAVSPMNAPLRQAVASWEAAHLPPKGLSRVLRRVHQWLSQPHPQAAQDFWAQTGGGSRLP